MAGRDPHDTQVTKIAPDHPMAGIVAEAYRVFEGPRPSETGVCRNCCMNAGIEADFFTPDPPNIPDRYLWDWYFAAQVVEPLPRLTWMWLLPRVLELLGLATEEDGGVELHLAGDERLLDRFPTGDSGQWSAEQWRVLEAFRIGYLDHVAGQVGFIDQSLCMFVRAGWPLEPLTTQIERWDDVRLARDFHDEWLIGGRKRRISVSDLWPDPEPVLDWYHGLRERFLRIAGQYRGTETGAKAAELVELLANRG